MATGTSDARFDLRFPAEFKEVIEEAATSLGQSVNDFAVSTLIRHARIVLEQRDVTVLSDRDRELFIQILDDTEAKPIAALLEAAEKYRKQVG